LRNAALVVLDNFEHVRTDENIDVLTDLLNPLTGCETLQLLVTSRIALHARYEKPFPLRPLQVPNLKDIEDVNDLIQYPATELYLQRAQNIKDDFLPTKNDAQFIVNICSLLDGLPLAIELVASRVHTHPPERMHQVLLRDVLGLENTYYINVPKRQVSLYKTIEWSYNLLTDQEKKLFRRLGVFAGCCRIESATEICNLGDLATNVAAVREIVFILCDYSLLSFDNQHMQIIIHSTLCDFAMRKLDEAKERKQITKQFIAYYDKLIKDYMMEKYVKQKSQKELEKYATLLCDEVENLYAVFHGYINILYSFNPRDSYPKNEMERLGVETYYARIRLMEKIWGDELPNNLSEEELKVLDRFSQAYQKVEKNGLLYPSVHLWEHFLHGELKYRFYDDLECWLTNVKQLEVVGILIEEIYQFLSDRERALFRRLGVFASSCSTAAARFVCNLGDLPTDETDFLHIAHTLSNSLLVIVTNEGIAIQPHAPISDFALQKLEKKEKEKLRKQFIDYYEPFITQYLIAKYEEQKSQEELKKELEKYFGEYVNYYEVYHMDNAYELMRYTRGEYIVDKAIQLLEKEGYGTLGAILEKLCDAGDVEEDEKINLINQFEQLLEIIEKKDSNVPYPKAIFPDLGLVHKSYSDSILALWG